MASGGLSKHLGKQAPGQASIWASKHLGKQASGNGSQVPGTLTCRLAFRRRKSDRGPDRDPVGILAGYVAAVDDIDRKNLVGPVTHAGLKPRLNDAWDIRCAGLAEGFQRQLQHIGEFPVEAQAIGQVCRSTVRSHSQPALTLIRMVSESL